MSCFASWHDRKPVWPPARARGWRREFDASLRKSSSVLSIAKRRGKQSAKSNRGVGQEVWRVTGNSACSADSAVALEETEAGDDRDDNRKKGGGEAGERDEHVVAALACQRVHHGRRGVPAEKAAGVGRVVD